MNHGRIETPKDTMELPAKLVEELLQQELANQPVMVCKLQLHSLETNPEARGADKNNAYSLPVAKVRFGGVWEGSSEKQAASENAVFGHWTPCAEFVASIMNQNVIDKLKPGKKYYVTFTEAPD